MKRILFSLLALFLQIGGCFLDAAVITTAPVVGTKYKIKCTATDHNPYLADDGTTLQGRDASGTWFVLEQAANGYYIKSEKTNKYINAESASSSAAITFDNEAKTYWTFDQNNAGTNSWAIRPNGTSGFSLNNNGGSGTTCPYRKINSHTSSTQNCNLWKFEDEHLTAPQFGGTVWTWNTGTSKFDAEGQESTEMPDRDNYGPVYKFENVGTVTTAVNTNTDTSDKGGIWVTGNGSNVTSNIGRWAGSIRVDEWAIASVNYSISLKGTEPEGVATVWVDGTLNITGRNDFNMNDGSHQRWYIGEHGVINTSFSTVTKGNTRDWHIQVVVGDQPERTGRTRVSTTLTKRVMTWGADISSNIASISVWYKNSEGTLTPLADAVSYDANGITITYTGLGYDEKTPSLPEGNFVRVNTNKADFLTPATSADDNSHWYIMTQTRGGETPLYDNGSSATMYRATVGTTVNGMSVADSKKYLVRFFGPDSDGTYDIQFATGKFVNTDLKTGTYGNAERFMLYKINDINTQIGWNRYNTEDTYGSRVDNEGAGNNLVYWLTGRITQPENNLWSIYPVEFIEGVNIDYTLTDNNGATYTGSYVTAWEGENTALPTIGGAEGYTLSGAIFTYDEDNGTYSATMNITFPFPVTSNGTYRTTGIHSQLGNGTWFAKAKENNPGYDAYSTNNENSICYANHRFYQWNIIPVWNRTNGRFGFKLKNVATDLYMPTIEAAQNTNTTNALVEAESSAGTFYYMPCTGGRNGFSINTDGTVFLTVNANADNQPIWAWTKSGSHQGSNLSFLEINKTEDGIKATFNALKAAEKLDILEGSTVQGPSEFAAPEEINTAIDAAQGVSDEVTAMEDFIASENGQKIQTYLNAKAAYGSLYNYQFEVKYEYGTIILPCPSTKPAGITFYSCNGTAENGTTLTLTDAGNVAAGIPYIFWSTVGNKYTIIGWDKNKSETYTQGWLTGNLRPEEVSVPEGSYVLAFQKSTNCQAFFKTGDSSITCPQHKCYLTVPSESEPAGVKAFYFEGTGEETAIEDVMGGDEDAVIYNLNGQKLLRMQKGINIIKGRKIIVK